MRRTTLFADSMVNIVQDIVAKDTSRPASEDCWVHADSTPSYTFQKVMHSALHGVGIALTVVLFRHYRLQATWGTREPIHIRYTMTCDQTMGGKVEFNARSPSVPLHWIRVQCVRSPGDIIVRTSQSVVPTECNETFSGIGVHGSYDTRVLRGCE